MFHVSFIRCHYSYPEWTSGASVHLDLHSSRAEADATRVSLHNSLKESAGYAGGKFLRLSYGELVSHACQIVRRHLPW